MDFKKPMISVILPVYNVEDYLGECLESLLAQTYKEFELIIINDGSTDDSLEIIYAYKKKFKQIKIITQENKGLSEARNAGYSSINGKYTYFLDSDDFILNQTFENLIRLAEENELDLVKFDAYSFTEKDLEFKMTNYSSTKYLHENKLYSRNEYLKAIEKNFMPAVWLYFIKTDIIKNNNLVFEKNILHEDEVFTVQLLRHCNRIMYDSNQYFQRRYRKNSIMTGNINKNMKSIQAKLKILKIFKNIIDNSYDDKLYKQFVKKRQNDIFTVLLFERNGKIMPYLKLLREYNVAINTRTAFRQMKKNIQL